MVIKDIELKQIFKDRFKVTPVIVRAPGRINIIGEHTDYNNGFVLPAAIDKSVIVVIGKSGSAECNLIAIDLNEEYRFYIDGPLEPVASGWANYFIGVLAGIQETHPIKEGFNMMFSSSIPIGSGLSSSAAIECGFGYAISELFNLSINRVTLAKIGQMAEHNYAGVKCGIMDQFAVVMGKKDQVIQLDCRSLEYQHYPADFGKYELVLFDTQVKHNLASSEYNIRRAQCEGGVRAIKEHYPEVNSLRDASLEMLDSIGSEISADVYKRCDYVIKENQRVISVCTALQGSDIKTVGDLMYETHDGLKNDYEVSCKELDFLVDLAKSSDTIIGARMMGGGFGGCTINLIASESASQTISIIQEGYRQEFGKEIKVYPVSISDGVHKIIAET